VRRPGGRGLVAEHLAAGRIDPLPLRERNRRGEAREDQEAGTKHLHGWQCSSALSRRARGAAAPRANYATLWGENPPSTIRFFELSICAFLEKRSPSTMCCWCRRSPRSCPRTPP